MHQQELSSYRQRLIEMRDRLEEDLSHIIERLPEKEMPVGEISTVRTHNADLDMDGIDREVTIGNSERSLLEQVYVALERVDRGDYGACQNCGRAIDGERLDALPFTSFCIECERMLESVTA